MEKIKSSRTIVIGLRNSAPPFAMVDAKGKPDGFSWDLCKAVTQKIAESLKTPIEIKVVPVSLPESVPLLNQGKIDLQCGSTTHTVDRAKLVDFSYTIFVSGIVAAYRKDEIKYANPSEFGRVGALAGSTAEKAVGVRVKNLADAQFQGLVPFTSYQDGVKMLKAGQIDTLVADAQLLPMDDRMDIRRQQMTVEPYALMMRKGDTNFVRAVDSALASIFASPAVDAYAAKAKLRVNYMTRDAWVHPGKTPAPPQF